MGITILIDIPQFTDRQTNYYKVAFSKKNKTYRYQDLAQLIEMNLNLKGIKQMCLSK